MPPAIKGVLETCLYVSDVERSARFYEEIFGFERGVDLGGRGRAMHAGGAQLLLLFKKGASREITAPHDGDGELHLAFAIAESDLEAWERWLERHAIGIEEKTTWPRGGRSIYFRDPDRHLLELVTPGTWPVY
jgi:catechol 2,3-dioxygenase-like lactoylglutathione lyase family enzyme